MRAYCLLFGPICCCNLSVGELENVMSMCVKEVEEDDELLKIPKNLWSVKKIEECNFWFLKSGVYNTYNNNM